MSGYKDWVIMIFLIGLLDSFLEFVFKINLIPLLVILAIFIIVIDYLFDCDINKEDADAIADAIIADEVFRIKKC